MRWPLQRRTRTAAVAPLTDRDRRAWRRLRQPWQPRAAEFATVLGVIRFASGIGADACARCDLGVEKNVDEAHDTWEPSDSDFLAEVLAGYRGKRQTQRELVRQHAWLQDTIGEALQILEPDGRKFRFSIRSPLAAEPMGNGLMIRDIPGGNVTDGTGRLVPDEMIRRMWIPDETWPGYATSPLHGVLDDCERYWTLGRRMRRTYESGLVGNGIVWTPSEAHTQLPRQQTEPGSVGQPGTDLERDYYATALRAFGEDDSVEAIAPILWRWPKEWGPPEKLDLSSILDEKAIDHRSEALECIARGLNYPQRLLVDGGANTNHWGQWLLQESFVKEAVNPKMERICWGDLTETYLRPMLRALAAKGLFNDDPELYRIGFDPTPVIVHPDQSKTALDLYKQGLLSDTMALNANGFDGSTVPDADELKRWILRTQIQRESIRPQTTSTLPSGASDVLAEAPQADPATQPVVAALTAASRVRESVLVGPIGDEAASWLDD